MFNADATHCKGGTLYRLTSFDANGHVVPVLQKWSVHNESKEAWKQIAQSARLLYGSKLNDDDVVIISDRDKGLLSGLHEELDRTHSRVCHKHLKDDVLKQCGASQVPIFEKIAFASSDAEFNAAFETANLRLKAFLG